MNFKKISIILILVGIMMFSVVGVYGADACTKNADCPTKTGFTFRGCIAGTCKYTHSPLKGVSHYGVDIEEGENIKVGESRLGDLLSGLKGIFSGSKAWLFTKSSYGAGYSYRKIGQDAIASDRTNKKFIEGSYVESSAYSVESFFAGNAATATRSESSGYAASAGIASRADYASKSAFSGACTLNGVRDYTGTSILLYGEQDCPNNMERYELLLNSKKEGGTLKTKIGDKSSLATYTGLIYCCFKKDQYPVFTYVGEVTHSMNIWFSLDARLPQVDSCEVINTRTNEKITQKPTAEGRDEEEPWEKSYFVNVAGLTGNSCVGDQLKLVCKKGSKTISKITSFEDDVMEDSKGSKHTLMC